ncbi:MAG: DNA-binding protein WhiA [Ruminococcaceae bacterium]|nr:DNA-binding protein WhiA [Oscillospiraceae bacterium]
MESFSSSVKSYLCDKSFEELGFGEKERVKWKECCGKAFLRAVFLFLAQEEDGAEILSSDREKLLEICAYLLIRAFDIEAKVLKRERGNRRGAILSLPRGTCERVLYASEKFMSEGCDRCRVLYIRAALLARGTIMDPEKGYHASFRAQNEAGADELSAVLESFGIESKKHIERGLPAIYLKESGKVEDLLSAIGAQKFSLQLMENRVEKSIRADISRRQNFDNANMARAINGAQSTISAIRYLESEGILETLSEPLQKAARLRLSLPEVSLAELCRFSEEKITKSGLNHRLQKLLVIAEKLKEEKEF